MKRRQRKLFGTIFMIVFVIFYALIVTAIAPRILLDGSRIVQMIFYVVAGLAWGIPLFPLIRWMERRGAGETE
ncbi:DUF2842 domain-containing protein [Terrarubrum flagellatum]|uniref:DUF2842 domain-containing protein n=1 Tax=Terrirubrum flagellatum TaxID=2895980 RepID=UPI003145679B